jgi:hypothetical protein
MTSVDRRRISDRPDSNCLSSTALSDYHEKDDHLFRFVKAGKLTDLAVLKAQHQATGNS